MKNGGHDDYGTQYFPNGYKFIRTWSGNKANGYDKLEYVDGTFYEGIYKDNYITQGICTDLNGANYSGTFSDDERHKEYFNEDAFLFSNGDSFLTKWVNGVPLKDTYNSKDGMILSIQDLKRQCTSKKPTKPKEQSFLEDHQKSSKEA